MDFNDIQSRLNRMYSSVDQRFDDDVRKHVKMTDEPHDQGRVFRLSFDASHNEDEALNSILSIIGNIANLKDHLKKKYANDGGNPKDIENEIDNSPFLQLVIDLHNGDKHGYPLTTKRSYKDPVIENIGRAISISADANNNTSYFTFSPDGQFESSGNSTIVITADIKDSQGKIICSFDELVDSSIQEWEKIITKFNLRN